MVDYDIPERVAALLRATEGGSLPLSRLHVALVAEGSGPGSYMQLRNQLARRTDLFLLIEPRHPLAGDGVWPGDLRGEYETALAGAGVDGGTRVALAPRVREAAHPVVYVPPAHAPDDWCEDDDPELLRRLDASLVSLWSAADNDSVLRAELAEAVSHLEEIRRFLSR